MSALPLVKVIRSAEQAAAVLDPGRSRLLAELAEPNSATGLARRLGLPRQQVNYHLRELEAAGLVVHVEDRRKGNCVERIMRAVASSFAISPEVLGSIGADPARVPDRASWGGQVALACRAIRDLADLGARAEAAGGCPPTTILQADVRFASEDDRAAFAEELADALAALAREYHAGDADADGRLHTVVICGYPETSRPPRTPAGPSVAP